MNIYDGYSNTLAKNQNQSAAKVSEATKRLGSGYRINSAADDAAGLAVSEKLRSLDRGLRQGMRNIKDGMNYLDVVDGASQEIHDMLHRMKELAVESANGTYSKLEREGLNLEYRQLIGEFKEMTTLSDYNGLSLFEAHSPTYGTKEGTVVHTGPVVINSSNDQLILSISNSSTCGGYKITIPHGTYDLYEFVDMFDTRLSEIDPGLYFGINTNNQFTLDYDGGILKAISGSGASLFYDTEIGSAEGFLIGVTKFESMQHGINLYADNPNGEDVVPGNNTIEFHFGNADDTVYKISLDAPEPADDPKKDVGRFVRYNEVISEMNEKFTEAYENGDMPHLVEAVSLKDDDGNYIIGLKSDVSITGLKGNFLYIEKAGEGLKNSPIYDIRCDNNFSNSNSYLHGAKAVPNGLTVEKDRNGYFVLDLSCYKGEQEYDNRKVRVDLLDEGEYTRKYNSVGDIVKRINDTLAEAYKDIFPDAKDLPFTAKVKDIDGGGKGISIESSQFGDDCKVKLDKTDVPSAYMVYDLFDAGTLKTFSPTPATSVYTPANYTGSLVLGDRITLPPGYDTLKLNIQIDAGGKSPLKSYTPEIDLNPGGSPVTYTKQGLLDELNRQLGQTTHNGDPLTKYVEFSITSDNKLCLAAKNYPGLSEPGKSLVTVSVSSSSSGYTRLIDGFSYRDNKKEVAGTEKTYRTDFDVTDRNQPSVSYSKGYDTTGKIYRDGNNDVIKQRSEEFLKYVDVPQSSIQYVHGDSRNPNDQYNDVAYIPEDYPATATIPGVMNLFAAAQTDGRLTADPKQNIQLNFTITDKNGNPSNLSIDLSAQDGKGLTADEAIKRINEAFDGKVTAENNNGSLVLTSVDKGAYVGFSNIGGTILRTTEKNTTSGTPDYETNQIHSGAVTMFKSAGTHFEGGRMTIEPGYDTFSFTFNGSTYSTTFTAGTQITQNEFVSKINDSIPAGPNGEKPVSVSFPGGQLILRATDPAAGNGGAINITSSMRLDKEMSRPSSLNPEYRDPNTGIYKYPPTATLSGYQTNFPLTVKNGQDSIHLNVNGTNYTINLLQPDDPADPGYVSEKKYTEAGGSNALYNDIKSAIDNDPVLKDVITVEMNGSSLVFKGAKGQGGDGTSISGLSTDFGLEKFHKNEPANDGTVSGSINQNDNTVKFPGYVTNDKFNTLFQTATGRIEINETNNVIAINVNGKDYFSEPIPTGNYSRSELLNILSTLKDSQPNGNSAPVIVSSSGNSLVIRTKDPNIGNGNYVKVSSKNTSPLFMEAIDYGDPVNRARRDIRCNMFGRAVIPNPYTVDYFNTMSFKVTTESGLNKTVNIQIPGGPLPDHQPVEYTPAELAKAITDSMNDPKNGVEGLFTCIVQNGRLVIKTDQIAKQVFISDFEGPLFDRVFQDPNYTSVTVHTEKPGTSEGTTASYILGRMELTPQTMEEMEAGKDVCIFKGINDNFIFDLTVGNTMRKVDITIPEGAYDRDELAHTIEKLSQDFLKELDDPDIRPEYFHAGIGLKSLGLDESTNTNKVPSDDRLVLAYIVPDDGTVEKLPFKIDGIRGSSCYRIFYEASDFPRPSYIVGKVDLHNGVNIVYGENNSFSVELDGVEYPIGIPTGFYTGKELANYLSDAYERMGAPVRATIKNDRLMIYTAENGDFIFGKMGLLGSHDIFYGGDERETVDMNIGIHTGRRTNSYIWYDKSLVGINYTRLNSSGITTIDLAKKAINRIDETVQYLSLRRANTGALRNRSEYAFERNEIITSNLTEAESGIRDADMAMEYAKLSKAQIVQQAQQFMQEQGKQNMGSVLNLFT